MDKHVQCTTDRATDRPIELVELGLQTALELCENYINLFKTVEFETECGFTDERSRDVNFEPLSHGMLSSLPQ